MNDILANLPGVTVTNPIFLWLFKQGWEDPGWGNLPVNQIALGLILHDLSNKLADRTLQNQLQEIAEQVISKNATKAVLPNT